MAGGGVGEASLVFGGWQPPGQPESFRSVEAHLGLGRFTLISIQEQKVPAWCSPARPLDALTALGLSRGSQLEIQLHCVCPSSACSPLFFSTNPFYPPPLPQPDSISLSNCSILRNAALGAFSKAPSRPNCKRKKRRKRDGGRKQKIQTSRPDPLTSTLAHLSN